MLFFKVLFAAIVGTAIGWAAGYIACTALYLALPHFVAPYFASDRVTIKVFAITFALIGCIAGLRRVPRSRWASGPVPALAERAGLSAVLAVLVGAGCAFFGSIAGRAAYSLTYEQLMRSGHEAVLETEFAPFAFAVVFGVMGLAAGIVVALRWRAPGVMRQAGRNLPTFRVAREEPASLSSRPSVQAIVLAALAGVGGGWTGNYLGYALGVWLADLLAMTGTDGKDFIILSIVATTAILFVSAVWLVLRHYGTDRGLTRLAARGAIALAAIALVTPSALDLSRRLDSAHEAIMQAPTIFFEVRLPADAPAPQSKDGISVELLTENGTIPGTLYQHDWIKRDGDRTLIAGFIDDAAPARQRMLVFALPGEPKRLFDLRLPRIPKSERHTGAWQRVDFVEGAANERRAASPADDFHIRFHAWRPS